MPAESATPKPGPGGAWAKPLRELAEQNAALAERIANLENELSSTRAREADVLSRLAALDQLAANVRTLAAKVAKQKPLAKLLGLEL